MQVNKELSFEVEANMEDVNREIENTAEQYESLIDSAEELHKLSDELRPIVTIRNSKNCHFSITINKGGE